MVVKCDMCLDKVEASESSRTSACSPKREHACLLRGSKLCSLEENSCKF